MGASVAEYSHEGASIWGWSTFRALAKHFRLTVSARLTPTSELMLTPYRTQMIEEEERARHEMEGAIGAWRQDLLVGTRQCPAKHPVIPYEIRVSMPGASRRRWIQCFPSMEGNSAGYVPVPVFFCAVCVGVYRPREVEVVSQSSEVPRV